ncbi:OmpA family protein [Legionella dresdenensis]|uniref:OmpA family protein n=1 Tax=Legionella dresdenensis TaxID=450200 RepID=A0ABV8CD67_9GAMM
MSRKQITQGLFLASFAASLLVGCGYQPPYNNFVLSDRTFEQAIAEKTKAGITSKLNMKKVLRDLQREDIQVIKYGDTVTLIVPTDRYYTFNSPRFNEICYRGLANIVNLIRMYPQCNTVYIAGFTDDIGSRKHKNMLSQAQAETMLTFLWANGIQAHRLNAEGYGDKHPVSDNKIIHGSAQNRRLEIQWTCEPVNNSRVSPAQMTK